MEVTKESVDNLNALLKVKVEASDYQNQVSTTLEGYRKQANIPGFRKGKVPMGLIKKQYGRSVLAEELNKLVSENLYKFIQDENLDILGNPLPKEDDEVKGDFDQPDTFEFTYEIGLSPEIDVKLSGRNKYEYTKVKIDDDLVNKQISDLRRRYGKLVSTDEVGEKDMVLGQFVELDENKEIKEGGIMHSSTISMEFVEDKKSAKQLLGKKVGDKVVLDPYKVSKGGQDTAAMLGIKEEELEGISNQFEFTINEVKKMELAELNQELFDKLFGEGAVKSEDEMKAKVIADLEEMFSKDSDKILTRRITNDLMEKTTVELPDNFLKRWIQASQKEPISMEDIEKDYENYAKGIRWQLIQNAIFKKNEIKVEREETINYTKNLLINQYAQYGIPAPEDKELEASAMQVLSNQEEAQRITDMLAEDKLTDYFKNTVKLADKEVSYDEYMKIAQDQNA
jgi:trigger factor